MFGGAYFAGLVTAPLPAGAKVMSYRPGTDPRGLLACTEGTPGTLRCGDFFELVKFLAAAEGDELPTFEPQPQSEKNEL